LKLARRDVTYIQTKVREAPGLPFESWGTNFAENLLQEIGAPFQLRGVGGTRPQQHD
jgi:hypothetical protein